MKAKAQRDKEFRQQQAMVSKWKQEREARRKAGEKYPHFVSDASGMAPAAPPGKRRCRHSTGCGTPNIRPSTCTHTRAHANADIELAKKHAENALHHRLAQSQDIQEELSYHAELENHRQDHVRQRMRYDSHTHVFARILEESNPLIPPHHLWSPFRTDRNEDTKQPRLSDAH